MSKHGLKNSHTRPIKFHRLSKKIVRQFCLISLITSALWGGLSFTLLYFVEDEYIEREVKKEAQYLQRNYAQTGTWVSPRMSHMQLVFTPNDLPKDIHAQYIANPKGREFFGEQGRHYHIFALQADATPLLVAQVSDMLIIRPYANGALRLMLILSAVLVVLTFFVSWLLGRKTALPLKQLTDLVHGVEPDKVPAKFAAQFPNNEIGLLAQTLEDTMVNINKAITREKCFTRDVSHELRTPIAIIKNAVEVYRTTHPDDVSNPVISRISQACTQMEQTVVTLLTLARQEHTDADKHNVKLLPLIEQAVIDHSHLINNKPIDVKVHDNCDISVMAQPGMVKVLLDNIIGNAFQYTTQGQVSIEVRGMTLIVADTGPGIEQSISANITDAFVKGEQSTGYGFGLSIVKRLCEHQNWLFKTVNNQGTEIHITLTQ